MQTVSSLLTAMACKQGSQPERLELVRCRRRELIHFPASNLLWRRIWIHLTRVRHCALPPCRDEAPVPDAADIEGWLGVVRVVVGEPGRGFELRWRTPAHELSPSGPRSDERRVLRPAGKLAAQRVVSEQCVRRLLNVHSIRITLGNVLCVADRGEGALLMRFEVRGREGKGSGCMCRPLASGACRTL